MSGYPVILFGTTTMCYGTLEETSNFQVVCEDEADDGVWCDGVEGLLNWDNVVMCLQPHFASNIIEITAV